MVKQWQWLILPGIVVLKCSKTLGPVNKTNPIKSAGNETDTPHKQDTWQINT